MIQYPKKDRIFIYRTSSGEIAFKNIGLIGAKAILSTFSFPPHKWDGNQFSASFEPMFIFIDFIQRFIGTINKMALAKILLV